MRDRNRTAFIASLLGLLLLSYPLVNVVNRPLLVLGIPLLYLYLFVLWAGLVALAWWLARGREA
jgi:hypothetical protein